VNAPAQIPTSLGLSASSISINAGDAVTLTAQLSPASAPGSLTFMDGQTSLGSGSMTNGQSVITTSSLTPGSHNLTAVYTGTGGYASAVSPSVGLTVIAQPLTIQCSASAGPVAATVPWSTTCTAAGGTPPYVWSISSGSIPYGMTASVSGATYTISGSTSVVTSYSFTIRVKDSATPAQSATTSYSGTIGRPPSLTASPSALSFSISPNSPTSCAPVTVNYSGPPPSGLLYTVTVSTTSGVGWLQTAATSGTLSQSGSAYKAVVSVCAAEPLINLTAGPYAGKITFKAGGISATVPVQLTASAAAAIMTSPSSLAFV
jgi:hypothetical protein